MTRLKRLEGSWKRFWIDLLCRLFPADPAEGATLDLSRPQRVLFLRQDRIGDAVVSSGVLRALRATSAGVVIDAVASPANAPILRRDPSLTNVYRFDKREARSFWALARQLRRQRYDVVIDCMVTAPSLTGLLLMLTSGARQRIGIAGRGIDAALSYAVTPDPAAVHIVDRMAAFAAPFGLAWRDADWRPHLALSTAEISVGHQRWSDMGGAGVRLLANISAGHPDREWPVERTIEALRRIRERFGTLHVGVVGAPQDRLRAERIAQESGAEYLETGSIDDLIGLVATADCVFTPDTSVTHIASALQIPLLAMFRNEHDALHWGRYGTPGADLIGSGETLAELELSRVLPELEELIAQCRSR